MASEFGKFNFFPSFLLPHAQVVRNLKRHFPYHELNDDDVDVVLSNEKWDRHEGFIKAKLSSCRGVLMMEITPWCLLNNRTELPLCFASECGDTSVVHAHQVAVPHHFTSVFSLRTSGSTVSRWYEIDEDVTHPSRVVDKRLGVDSTKIWHGSVQCVSLKMKNSVVDFVMKCSIRFGMLIIDVSPMWNISNVSSLRDLAVCPCVGGPLYYAAAQRPAGAKALAPPRDRFAALTDWQHADDVDVEKTEPDPATPTSDDSTTVSSFMCLDQLNSELYKVVSMSDRLLTVATPAGFSAAVSVRDTFVRKLLNLKHIASGDGGVDVAAAAATTADNKFHQLYLTREVHDKRVYMTIADVTQPDLAFYNHTKVRLLVREEQQDLENRVEIALEPGNHAVGYECATVSENFPHCKRKALNLRFGIRTTAVAAASVGADLRDDDCNWSQFSLNIREERSEVVLHDGLVVWIQLQESSPMKVHLYEGDHPREATVVAAAADLKKQIPSKTHAFKLVLAEFKLVCLDDASAPLYSLDILQCGFRNVAVEIDDNISGGSGGYSSSTVWNMRCSLDDVQCDTHICRRYPVFVTSQVREGVTAAAVSSTTDKDDTFSVALQFNDRFAPQAVDVRVKSVEVMCEDGFLKVLARLFDTYSKAIRPRKLYQPATTLTDHLQRNAAAICTPLRLTFISVQPFNAIVTLNASYKFDVTIHKGSVNFTKLLCLQVCGRWLDVTEEVARHYFTDAVFSAGWMLGSADIIGNPMTTLRNFSRGFTDLFLMPYTSIGAGPSAFLNGLTGGVSSLMRNVSYGLLQSMTNVASGLSRNIGGADGSGEHAKSPFCTEIPGTDVKVYLPHGGTTSVHEAAANAPGYILRIGRSVANVVTKPLGGAASLVSRVGETIIVKSGMSHEYTPVHASSSHCLSSYESSLEKLSQKVSSFFDDSDSAADDDLAGDNANKAAAMRCIVSMTCLVDGDESRVWVLSKDRLFIMRTDDDTTECQLIIADIELTCDAATGVCEVAHVLQPSTAVTSGSASKVAQYLGVECLPEHMAVAGGGGGGLDETGCDGGGGGNLGSSGDSSKYRGIAVDKQEAVMFAAVFRVLKNNIELYSW